MIICYYVRDIWCMTDVIVSFHFGLSFALLPHNCPQNQNFKKLKKHPEISLFYTRIPKTMIIWGTVSEIWKETGRIFVILDHFLLLYPSNNQKNQNFKTMKKALYPCVPKITIIWCMVPEIWPEKSEKKT